MPSPPGSIRRLTLLVGLTLALPFVARAQTNASASTPSPLPPAAQSAENQGILAAKGQDYRLAIQNFQEARKSAPDAPELFYQLGLAEANVPGRELRAICWLGAYLAASPQAPNAATVKEQIAALETTNQSNLSCLIDSMQDEVSKLPIPDYGLEDVADLWVEAGDFTTALKTAGLIQDSVIKSRAQSNIADAQALAGDFSGALKTAALIQYGLFKSSAQSDIAKAQTKAADIAGALKTAALIQDPKSKCSAQVVIATAQTKAGDVAGAKETLASAIKTAELIQYGLYRGPAQGDIALAQAQAGDIAGALKTADRIDDVKSKSLALLAIVPVQAKAGDAAGAKETLDWAISTAAPIEPIHEGLRGVDPIQSRVTSVQAQLNPGSPPAPTRSAPIAIRVLVQPELPATNASAWLGKLLDSDPYRPFPLNTAPFLDWDAYEKTLPSSDDPQKLFDAQHGTAHTIARAQTVINQMLKSLAQ